MLLFFHRYFFRKLSTVIFFVDSVNLSNFVYRIRREISLKNKQNR